MWSIERKSTVAVHVGDIQIGGGAPIVVQSMTNTNTADATSTSEQIKALADAGSELVRMTVNTPDAAAAVPEIRSRLHDMGCAVPLIGDFHYNGHKLLTEHPACAAALDKYRINPGNVGHGKSRDDRFAAICHIASDLGKPVRIGVNIGSLDEDLVMHEMEENTRNSLGKTSSQVLNECMVLSALRSTELALENGLSENQIILSCKASLPADLIDVCLELSKRTRQPLHLGLTEAGMGAKGLVWSATSLAILLAQGIGDTIRVSLTPQPGGDRREEVYAACEILQSLGLRSFSPSITSCPGCGRTTSTTFQVLAERVQAHVRQRMPEWRMSAPGAAGLRLAVMGCVVNGPGESRAAHIGISLPGTGEAPRCPVYIDGERHAMLEGAPDELAKAFCQLIDNYVNEKYARTNACGTHEERTV